jgi:hypothetical protein
MFSVFSKQPYSLNLWGFPQKYVYACTKDTIMGNVNCMRLSSYEDAELYYQTIHINKHAAFSTLVPVCGYVPFYFHSYILHYKLSKILVKIKINN